MKYIVYICGGPRDGEVLMETESRYKAICWARWAMGQLYDEEIDQCVAIDSDEGPVMDW